MERIKSDFVSTVSHELRTPLTAIRGSLGLVMGGVGGVLPEKALTLIRMAHNSTERLTRLINDLLDVQKIEAGKFDYHFRIFALGKLINEAVEGNQAYAQRLQVAIELEGRVPDVALRVDGDRFQQVMSNLISNACKYSPQQGKVSVRCQQRDAQHVRIEVIDRGPGIPKDFQQRIFQKFSQADSSDTKTKEGTGLGLAIAKTMVLQMRGNLDFHSSSSGTCFFIDFPCMPVNEDAER
jgi:signal transduction histidine kinase